MPGNCSNLHDKDVSVYEVNEIKQSCSTDLKINKTLLN